jgi:nucleotide-binding universal stress UspA family protein
MPFRDIVVHVDNGPASERRVHLACEIARRHRAYLLGFYCFEPLPFTRFSPWGDPGYSDFASIQTLQQNYRAAALVAAGKIEAVFHAEANRAGINGEWRFGEGIGTASVARQARYADLVVLGQVDREAPSHSSVVPEEVVLSSGRPVLIVPPVGRFESACRRVFVAWNASREAVRAVGDALPLLLDAEAVTILSITAEPSVESEQPASALTQHLARHGVEAEATAIVAKDPAVGALLLARAADFRADLIVMGAYGHSRTRELLLGGATRHLLQHTSVPLLMSH